MVYFRERLLPHPAQLSHSEISPETSQLWAKKLPRSRCELLDGFIYSDFSDLRTADETSGSSSRLEAMGKYAHTYTAFINKLNGWVVNLKKGCSYTKFQSHVNDFGGGKEKVCIDQSFSCFHSMRRLISCILIRTKLTFGSAKEVRSSSNEG
jgi:hypothetical protein